MYKIILTHTDTDSSIELQSGNVDNILPININDFQNEYKRSEEYHGVLRSFGQSLEFGKNAAKFIERYYVAHGAGVTIAIEMYYDKSGIDWKRFYSGKLDLTTYKKEYKTDYEAVILCNVVNGDFEHDLISNLETDYVFNDFAEYTDVTFRKRNNYIRGFLMLDKKQLEEEELDLDLIKSLYEDDKNSYIFYPLLRFKDYYGWMEPLSYPVDERINAYSVMIGYEWAEDIGESQSLFQANAPCDVYLKGRLRYGIYDPESEAQVGLMCMRKNKNGEVVQYYHLKDIETGEELNDLEHYFNGTYNFYIDYVEMDTGDNLFLFINVSEYSSDEDAQIGILNNYQQLATYTSVPSTTTYLYLDIKEGLPDSTHKAIEVEQAFNVLTEKATGESNRVESSILGGNYDYMTSGEQIRSDAGLYADYPITTNIQDLLNALNIGKNLGIGIDSRGFEKKVKIDHKSKFYEPEIIMDIGDVKELTEEFAADRVYNSISFSYPDLENELLNNRYEFNTKLQMAMPMKWNKNALEIASSYIAAGAEIEAARRQPFSEAQSTNEDNDTNLFLVSCWDFGGTIKTRRDEAIDGYEGVEDTTFLYNVEYYPATAIRNWACWMLSGMQHDRAENSIELSGIEMNKKVKITDTDYVGGSYEYGYREDLEEGEGQYRWDYEHLLAMSKFCPFESGRGAIFEPVYYEFKAPVTFEFINKFEGNRHGVVQFSYAGATYYGYPIKIPAVPGRESAFKLLKISRYAESLL